MSTFLRFTCTAAFLAGTLGVSFADVSEPTQAVPNAPVAPTLGPRLDSWLEALWNLPMLHLFIYLFQSTPASEHAADSQPIGIGLTDSDAAARGLHAFDETVSACPVKPLDAIEDPEAQQLEASVGSSAVVDVSDMVPAASEALERFESKVAAVGGTMILKSAYRPMAYQRHLQNVWYKWINELRGNIDPACQELRTQVQDEFTRHHLIETQHPVAMSDHTRGLAFDASVDLPGHTRVGRRQTLTLDSLAHFAGLVRPAIESDPVHFKYVGRGPGWHHRQPLS